MKKAQAVCVTGFFALLLLIGILIPSSSKAIPIFPNPQFPAGTGPVSLQIADFNGDEIPDVVVANLGSGDISLFFGMGDGSLRSQIRIQVGELPSAVTVGDLDGNGILDIVIPNRNDDDVSILLGLGEGKFQPGFRVPVGDFPLAVTIGDFNGDGKQDLAVANTLWDQGNVLLGDGSGSFIPGPVFPTGDHPVDLLAFDCNDDEVLDLVVVNHISDDLSVLSGVGDGSFGTQVFYPVGDDPGSPVVGDFDGDGESDLAIVNFRSDDLSVLLGAGSCGFLPENRYEAGINPQGLTIEDFNGDGDPDLAVANFGTSAGTRSFAGDISVLLGGGDGTFGPASHFGAGFAPRAISSGDFNFDGIKDLAVGNGRSSDLSIILGLGDGSFGPEYRFPILGARPSSIAISDFNLDGIEDLVVGSFRRPSGAIAPTSVSVLLGSGNGGLAPAVPYGVGTSPISIAVGEFNGDGIHDLTVVNVNSFDLSILRGQGDGSFAPEIRLSPGGIPYFVGVGDFNRDGLQDLLLEALGEEGRSLGLARGAEVSGLTGERQQVLALAGWTPEATSRSYPITRPPARSLHARQRRHRRGPARACAGAWRAALPCGTRLCGRRPGYRIVPDDRARTRRHTRRRPGSGRRNSPPSGRSLRLRSRESGRPCRQA